MRIIPPVLFRWSPRRPSEAVPMNRSLIDPVSTRRLAGSGVLPRRARLLIGVSMAAGLALSGCSVSGTDGAAAERSATNDSATDSEPVMTDEDNLSTFAVDIDTASYEYARQSILNGWLPESENVRPEEFVNHFRQDYPEPVDDGFTVTVDGAVAPEWYTTTDQPTHLIRVGLQTRTEPEEERSDAHLTFVIDTSGSMDAEERLPVVKESLRTLVDELRPTDAIAIVTYSDQARVVQPMTDVADRAEIHAAIQSLTVGGSTNMEDGLALGYQAASEGFGEDAINRVILLSDGLANTGSTEHDQILATARDKAADGITLLCVGVGMAYGDNLMEQLADNGDGFAVYFSTATQARKLFAEQLAATLAVRAKDAKVQVTFDPEVVESYRLIGFENRAVADEDFTNDSVDGGEVGPGHSVTALYAVTIAPEATGPILSAAVRWLDPDTGVAAEAEGTTDLADTDVDLDSASQRLAVDLIAVAFAEALRGNELATGLDLATLADQASRLAEATEDADVVELAELIAAAHSLRG